MADRILISFKKSELDKQLMEYLKKQSEIIGPSAYMKKLIYEDMKKNSDNSQK